MTAVVRPPDRSVSWKGQSEPAGVMRRPSGSTSTPVPSGPAYFAASPVGALTVHWPGVTAGYVPSQSAQALACGLQLQSPRLGQLYGVVVSEHASGQL